MNTATGLSAVVAAGTVADSKAQLARITGIVEGDLARVDAMIAAQLDSDIALIRQLGAYIIGAGGKRLRPVTVLLVAQACGYTGCGHIALAAVIEFIHTATLLHDDVVDESALRRGRSTANEVWGNAASVLVGDFLYSRAFQIMVGIDQMPVMRIMADTTNAIAEGEVMQLLNAHSPEVTEQRYLDTIERKTARLFQAAAELGAVIAGRDTATRRALGQYGLHVGRAFQLIDDLLDYRADSTDLGKNAGDDLAEGKPTLPVIQALKAADARQQTLIRAAITSGDRSQIAEILEIVESTGALAYTSARAAEEAAAARCSLDVLADSPCKACLGELADFAVARAF